MLNVLQMTRILTHRPTVPTVSGIVLRTIRTADDVPAWLELRRRAFMRERVGVREWTEQDFATEFLSKPWWRPERMWIAEAERFVGSVTLARRGDGPDAKPVVHWLMVDRAFRRRGIGQLLMATLETAVWDDGGRQVWLETHRHWQAAVDLYRQLGYVDAMAG